MSLRLVFRPRVGQDLAGAFDWYEQRQTGLGEEFLEAVERFPELFPRVHGEVRRAMVSRFPYVIFYRIEVARIVVLAVLHTARNPELWP